MFITIPQNEYIINAAIKETDSKSSTLELFKLFSPGLYLNNILLCVSLVQKEQLLLCSNFTTWRIPISKGNKVFHGISGFTRHHTDYIISV